MNTIAARSDKVTLNLSVNTLHFLRIFVMIIIGYEGLGGVAGGIMLLLKPDGRLMEMPVEIMHGAFRDFFIPGTILLTLGALNLFAFFSVLRNKMNDWFWISMALGGYTIWFIVEIIILHELHWLHLMWGTPVLLAIIAAIPLISIRKPEIENGLLLCGLASSAWYVLINILVPIQYNGYNIASYTVSELSATGAPTRILWVLLCSFYPLLFAAFGWGLIKTAKGNRKLLAAGYLIIIYALINVYWPPMHMRGITPTLTDTLHIIWASVTVLLMFVIMILLLGIFNNKFRLMTFAFIILMLVFGTLTSREAPNIPINGPTPFIGIWERINIGLFMLWIGILSDKIYKLSRK
jgi:hypothetical protein